MTSQLEWVAVEARTGRQLAFLPELKPTTALKRTIGRYDSASFTLPVARAPRNWMQATRRGGAWLLALLDDAPIGGWLVITRKRTWSADPAASLVPLTGPTAEGYLDRRYVGDVTYTATGQNDIVADLIARFVADRDDHDRGIPIRVDTAGLPGMLRDCTYLDQNDKTVYSVLTDLAGVIDGPQWTIEWERFVDTPIPRYRAVLRVGDRVGQDPPPGLAPPTFDLPGCVITADLIESYEAGKGANRVTATGQKSGDDRAQATVQDDTDLDLPIFELRGSVSTANSDNESLADHAAAAVAIAAPGQNALTLTADAGTAPRLGPAATTPGAWRLGDTVGVDLSTPDGGGQGAFSGAFTCVGWEWDTTAEVETVTPILAVPQASL